MHDRRFGRRWGWPIGGLVAGLMVVLLMPQWGFTKAATAPLWTERPVAAAATPAVGEGWVRLVRELKPAVVNISTKRAAVEAPAATSPFGYDERVHEFFRPFFGTQGRRPRPRLGSGSTLNQY